MRELDIDKIKSELQSKFDAFAEKLEPVYEILDWHWASCGIPKKADIIRCLNDLLDDVQDVDLSKDFPSTQIGTGGLYVGYEVFKNNGMIDYIEIILRFQVDEDVTDDAINYMKEIK